MTLPRTRGIRKPRRPEEIVPISPELPAIDEDMFLEATERRFPEIALRAKSPDDMVVQVDEFGRTDPDAFLADLKTQGRTRDTEVMLQGFGFKGEDIDELFPDVEPQPPPVELPQAKSTFTRTLETFWGKELVREVSAATGKPYAAVRNEDIEAYIVAHPEIEGRIVERQQRLPVATLLEEATILGRGLRKLPRQLGASILQAAQGFGGASVVDKDWADRFIESANTDFQKFVSDISEEYAGRPTLFGMPLEDLASVSQSLAFSLTSMGAGIGTGLPIAAIPVPGSRVAAWVAGTAASGAVAYNITVYQITQQYLEIKNEEMLAERGRGLTQAEETKLKDDFASLARRYGLWEAIPEAVSNLAFVGILTAPLSSMFGRSIATQIVSKIAGLYGQELLTETITQKGQSQVEIEAGFREGSITWVEAFKEIAPQTFLLTTILAGAGQVIISSRNALTKTEESLKEEIGEDHSLYKEFIEKIRTQFAEAIRDERGGIGLPQQPGELTGVIWNAMSVAEKRAAAVRAELGESVGGKAFDRLTEAEKSAMAKVIPETAPDIVPPTPLEARLQTELVKEGFVAPVPEAVPEVIPPINELVFSGSGVAVPSNFFAPGIEKPLDFAKARLRSGGGGTPIIRVYRRSDIEAAAGVPLSELAERPGEKEIPSSEFSFSGLQNVKPIAEIELPRGFATQAKDIEGLLFQPTSLPTEAVAEVTAEVVPEADIEVRRQLNELSKMHDIWSKRLKDREQVKIDLANFIKATLPTNVRGRFLGAVARVKTDGQLDTQIAKVTEFAELNAQKVLKADIRKEIKKAQVTVKDHIKRGKFTPDVQRRLDVINHNLDLGRDTARERMSNNIQKYDNDELSYEEMLEANEALNFAGIEGMSSEELAGTLEYIKILETVGRSARQAKQAAATVAITATRSDIMGILTGGQGLKTGIGAVPRKGLAAQPGWLDTFTNWQYSIDDLADKLSKFDTTSEPFQSELNKFVAQVHRATNRQAGGTREAYEAVRRLVEEVYGVKGNREVNQVLNVLETEVNLGTFELTPEYKANHPEATTVTIKMTANEMIAKYMQMQDYTLNDTFTTGMGWSQQVRDAVTNGLKVEERALGDAIFRFYEDYYTSVNEVYQEIYNVDLSHNPKYSPIRRDFEGDVVENLLTFQDASQFASVLNGSLKARQRNIRPLRFNGATQTLSNHIEQMEHFKAWALTMRDMRRVFANKEIRLAIEQYHGRGIGGLLDTFLNQMARGGVETASTNRAADFLRRNFTKSILAIKPVIALKQIPSLFGYVSEMNVADFAIGIADFWTAPVKHFKFLHNNSEMFRSRMSLGFERDIAAALKRHGSKVISGKGKFTDWFLLQIRAGDTFAVSQGMWAKYREGLKKGLSQEEAIAAAEDTTGRTQPSFGIDTLSAIQNGGSFLKLLTMFQNQPNKYFRIAGDNMRNFKYGRGSRAKAASTILLVWVILPMMFQYISDAFQWKPERQARAGLLGPLNFVLIGGQLVQSMWGWLTDQPFDYQVSPVAQTARDLQMIFQKAKKLVEQGQDPTKDISIDDVADLVEYLAKAGGQVTGLPTPYFVQVEKIIRRKFEEGEAVEIKDFLFSGWSMIPPEKNAEQKVEEASLKLGEVKEGQEDAPLSEKDLKLYTTVDWFREIGNIYDNVLPRDIIDDPKASTESQAWASYEIARSNADILPNVALYRINTDDNDDTIIEYYQQWKARERIDSLPELQEFDKLYPKVYLGNVTRQQYSLLKQYLEVEDKDAFLESHPELLIDPRDEWLEARPVDNAWLVLGGQGKLLSMDAYNEFNKLVKRLDIPEDAIRGGSIPSEEVAESYFKISTTRRSDLLKAGTTKQIAELYLEYSEIYSSGKKGAQGDARDFRRANPILQQWGEINLGWKPLEAKATAPTGIRSFEGLLRAPPKEEILERNRKIIEDIRAFGEEAFVGAMENFNLDAVNPKPEDIDENTYNELVKVLERLKGGSGQQKEITRQTEADRIRIAEEKLPEVRKEWLERWGVTEVGRERFENYPIEIVPHSEEATASYSRRQKLIRMNPSYVDPSTLAHEIAHANFYEQLSEEQREAVKPILDYLYLNVPAFKKEVALAIRVGGRRYESASEKYALYYDAFNNAPDKMPYYISVYYYGLIPPSEPGGLGMRRWLAREGMIDFYKEPFR